MKFGICTSPDKAARLAPGTIDYIEMNLSHIQKMTAGELAEAQSILQSIDLTAEAANCFFPAEIRLCGRSYSAAAVREYTKCAMDHAAQLGIHTCVLGSSKSRSIDDGDDRADCLRQFEEALVVAGDIARQYDSLVVLEPLNAKETNNLNTVAEGAAICRRLAHPSVRLLADYYHVMYAKEPLSVYTDNADLLCHLHIADPIHRQYPLPEDGCDYAPLAQTLKRAGYTMRLSLEGGCSGDFVTTTEASIAYLRRLFA